MFTSLLSVARFIRVKVAPVKSIPLALAFSDITEKFIVAPSKSIAVLLLVQNGTDSPTGGGSDFGELTGSTPWIWVDRCQEISKQL